MKNLDYIYISGALYLQETLTRIRNILIPKKKVVDIIENKLAESPEK